MTMCLVFVSVAVQSTVQNEVREPSRDIYDLCESCSGGTGAASFLTVYLFSLMICKAVSDIDFIWYSQHKTLQEVCEFHRAGLLGPVGGVNKYRPAPALRVTLSSVAAVGWEVGRTWTPQGRGWGDARVLLLQEPQTSWCWTAWTYRRGCRAVRGGRNKAAEVQEGRTETPPEQFSNCGSFMGSENFLPDLLVNSLVNLHYPP